MSDRCLCPDFELRGETYEIHEDSMHPSNRALVDRKTKFVVDTDHGFDPPLTNDELLAIYDYGKGF
jgi:imidazolonepropionase-like amidohydrolase